MKSCRVARLAAVCASSMLLAAFMSGRLPRCRCSTFPHSIHAGVRRKDVRHGLGCHRMADGTQYAGEFRDDAPHGHGAFVFASGQTYEGQWAAGRREGWCLYSVSASEVWAGEDAPPGPGLGRAGLP